MEALESKFQQRAFLRLNAYVIQEILKEIGYHICPCCNFKDAVWLCTSPANGSVHGIGYSDETRPLPVELELKLFLSQKSDDEIDCGTNEELFLAIAALRDDTDKHQWFTDGNKWVKCSENKFSTYWICNNTGVSLDNIHKATVDELIKHFKNE